MDERRHAGDGSGGTHELFFVFVNNPGDGGLFNINWFQFVGQGVGTP